MASTLMMDKTMIKFAEENSNRAAERQFKINVSQARRWRQQKSELESEVNVKRRKLQGPGRPTILGNLEDDLLEKIDPCGAKVISAITHISQN